MLFKKNQISLNANQTKYGQIKVVNFTINQSSHGCKIIMQKCMQGNYVEMYSTQNAGKCVLAERFISNYKIYKYMTPISKNMYIDKNQGIYLMNPAMHGTIKMKPYDVNYSTCIDFGKKKQ